MTTGKAMIIGSRGVSMTTKSVMKELGNMVMSVSETHFDLKKKLDLLASYMDVNECDSTIFFETTKRIERLWVATERISMRFVVINILSIYEMATLVNYHKGAGHVLVFSEDFDQQEGLKIVKEIFDKVFSSPPDLPKERALCFFYYNGSIFMRNYLLGSLNEVGPRIEIKLEKILDGCFKGPIIFFNGDLSKKPAKAQVEVIES